MTLPALAVVYFQGIPSLPVGGSRFWLTAWSSAALFGAIYGLGRHAWRQTFGMALMLVGVMTTALAILNDLAPLIAGGREIVPFTRFQLSTFYMRKLLIELGYMGVGFLLWSGWRPHDTLHDIARRLRETGLPMGGRSEGRSALIGYLGFPVLLAATYVFTVVVEQQAPRLVNNDETGIWQHSTWFSTIMLSAAASLGEEILYRGFILVGLSKILQRWMRPTAALWTACSLQAVFFGFAHASYGNWLHVLQATSFGFISGAVAILFGIMAAIVLHFLIDIYAIGVHVDSEIWFLFLLATLLANVLVTIGAGGRWLWKRSADGEI